MWDEPDDDPSSTDSVRVRKPISPSGGACTTASVLHSPAVKAASRCGWMVERFETVERTGAVAVNEPFMLRGLTPPADPLDRSEQIDRLIDSVSHVPGSTLYRAGMTEHPENYEDVSVYGLDDDVEQEMLLVQNECTFIWSNKEGWPVGVIMSYVFRDGKFWLTASSQRARISAVRRDPARLHRRDLDRARRWPATRP